MSGKAWELKAAMPQRLGHSRAGAGSGQWWEVDPRDTTLALQRGDGVPPPRDNPCRVASKPGLPVTILRPAASGTNAPSAWPYDL